MSENLFISPTAYPTFYRTYSHRTEQGRESWEDVVERNHQGFKQIGNLTDRELENIKNNQLNLTALPSGRWLWVGGGEWLNNPKNFYGAYNCTSLDVIDWKTFGMLMNLAMCGTGTGAVLEPRCINQLPIIRNKLNITIGQPIGVVSPRYRTEFTEVEIEIDSGRVYITVGDSREGWVDSYQALLELSSRENLPAELNVYILLGNVRPAGEKLKGFGGTANPIKLENLYSRVAKILNNAVGRQLDSVECCLLIDEASWTVVAGNIRRSAGMKQFIDSDNKAASCKLNLYTQTPEGQWRIDSDREALKMSNHTRIFYHRPTLEECLESLHLQYHCGEGAMMFAPEMIARANADLLDTKNTKDYFIDLICSGEVEAAKNYLLIRSALKDIPLREGEIFHRMERVGLNPCGEIGMKDNLCNLAEVPLNRIDPHNVEQIISAFAAAAHSVCCLLHHEFDFPRFQFSREVDPIVAVSFTGMFDFFVQLFGVDWLHWWEAGRPKSWTTDYSLDEIPDDIRYQPVSDDSGNIYKLVERLYLTFFRKIVENTVFEYCDRSGIRVPNRCTTLQPSGTKSLLTGASPGWHPPKAARFIRRITFSKNDPVALACIDYGYKVVPGQDDRDESGFLLDDPFDPRVNTWLVEIPTSTIWADIPGADKIDISKFSALAQLDMLEQVQRYYVTHNTSATVEIRKEEIPDVAQKFYELMQANCIVSTTVLARMDDKQTFPRLPFEPIDQETYDGMVFEVLSRRKSDNFHELLASHDHGLSPISEMGPAPCDSDKCLISTP